MKIVDQDHYNSRPPDTFNLNHLFIRLPPSFLGLPFIPWDPVEAGWGRVGQSRLDSRRNPDGVSVWECRRKVECPIQKWGMRGDRGVFLGGKGENGRKVL